VGVRSSGRQSNWPKHNDRGAAQTVNDTDAADNSRRRTADVNTVGTDEHAALMDPETDVKAASSPAEHCWSNGAIFLPRQAWCVAVVFLFGQR